MERRHIPIVVVTLLAALLSLATLMWQRSSESYTTAADQALKTLASSSTFSSKTPPALDSSSSSSSTSSWSSSWSHPSLSSNSSFTSSRPPWLNSYIQWHEQQLRTNASHYSFVMYSCTQQGGSCGGIGDRLNGIIQAFYTAMCHQRVFLIEYDTPYPLTVSLWPQYLQWNATPPRDTFVSVQRIDWMDFRTKPTLIEPDLLRDKEQNLKARGWIIRTNLWMEKTMPTSTCLQRIIHPESVPPTLQQPRLSTSTSTTTINTTTTTTTRYIPDADDLYRWAFDALFQIAEPVMERTRLIQQRTGLAVLWNETPNVTTIPPEQSNVVNVTTNITTMTAHDSSNTNTNNSNTNSKHPAFVLQPYVAMHVRTGHGSTWGGDPLRHSGNQTLMKFRQCAKHLQQRLAMKLLQHQHHQHQHSPPQQQQQPTSTIATTLKTKTLRGSGEETTTITTTADTATTAASATTPLTLPLVYIASDNVAVKQQFEEWDNATFRYDHLLTVVHADKTKDPPLESYLDVWAEMVILWQAKALVMSVSKFSQLAEVLGQFTNDTARYFDQCDFDDAISTTTTNNTTDLTMTVTPTTAAEFITIEETATPTHHDHRDQADETYIETRRTKGTWLAF